VPLVTAPIDWCALPPQTLPPKAPLGLYLTFDGSVFKDLAPGANPALANSYRKEGAPDCSTCGTGSFVSTNCTHNTDRMCAACTRCGVGSFTVNRCSEYADTTCKLCGTCALGSYSSVVCGSAADQSGVSVQDTVCSPCSPCDELHYEGAKCTVTADTLCNTCMQCRFTTDAVRDICGTSPAYKSWVRSNCCIDKFGVKVPCAEIDRQNIKFVSLMDRHQWAFEKTSPKGLPITGPYKLGKMY
jgi:hypothetical protein